MHVVTLTEAPLYEAPGHQGMTMRRLQGREAGPSQSVWIGLSEIEPGGGTTTSASNVEKFYVVLEGCVEIVACTTSNTETTVVLQSLDSCRIEAGESRRLRNPASRPCKLMLVMPVT